MTTAILPTYFNQQPCVSLVYTFVLMNFSVPYFSGFPPPINGTHAAPASHATGFHTSDARSTGSNSESNLPPRDSCLNCSSYHCKSDDEKFLRAMEEGRDDYIRRLGWIWYCICEAAPRADRVDHKQVWRTLVESDDIWSTWEDGDDMYLPVAPVPQVGRWFQGPVPGSLDFILPIISRKIDLHSKNRCSPKLTPSPSPITQNTSIHMRLAIVLWKTLLATRGAKYPRNPSSVNCEIPSLIPKWWDMLPEFVKANLIIDDCSWDRFCGEQKRRGHSCTENLPEKKMWSTWITVQTLIGASIPLDIPLNDKNCQQCLDLREQPFGRSEFVKPHVLALWSITRAADSLENNPDAHPDSVPDSPCIFSHYTSWYETLNLRKSLFNQATLCKVDEWLTGIWSSSNDRFNNSNLRKHVGKTLNQTPHWLEGSLYLNENDLGPHWTETQTAISKISSSESIVGSEFDSVEPASWISAVALFALAKIYGLGPLTIQLFVDIIEHRPLGKLFGKAPLLSNTPPSKKFHEALKRSGHTCWPQKFCGPNSLTNLYFSAYSLLLGTSDAPVVGREERDHRTKCAACHVKCAFHDFSLVLDEDILDPLAEDPKSPSRGPRESLSDKHTKGRVKRLIIKLNHVRYQNDVYENTSICYESPPVPPAPLNHSDLIKLTKKLSSLSKLFQYALENDTDMNLLDSNDRIFLGYDSESDPGEDTQESNFSMPENSAQLSQPVSNHENDTNPAQPHAIFENNSFHTYHNNHPHFSTEQVVPQTQNVTEGRTTLPHSHYPPQLYSPFDNSPHLQLPMPNQSGTDRTQSYSQTIDSPVLYTRSNLNKHAFPPQESGNSVQHMQQIDVSLNGSHIPNPPQPPPAPEGQTYENTPFSLGYNTRPARLPRVDKMRTEIKKQLLFMLESKKIQITAGKLPWRNLFRILQEHNCEFENWPEGIPEPSTQNGIEKAPQDEIKAIYKALIDKERPLRIRRIDGHLGGADRIFISQDPSGSGSGNKRSGDEQGSNVEERGSNRRKLEM
ncbi:hypothetical protein K435DRAFT_972681 [Dendrothele bispora CBS 962.96]|uniref:Uncharacterized protein n=1 Tax=Dendrothele bispora (strain CBS 962.96) TaxID=1314807 RepID=A0A4S8KXC7_DENBC|nr:hypothetical protein K435DRAFT_972681 [Dendrothele bispora CBS 962.96]